MKLFMSCEAMSPATMYILDMERVISPMLDNFFKEKKYGNDVESFYLISPCVSRKFIKDTGWKERNMYSKKDKSTDVRLFIDWETFISVSREERKKMYFEHIYQSIEQFGKKHPKLDFDWERMLKDMKDVLSNIDL